MTLKISKVHPLHAVQDEGLDLGLLYKVKANFPVIDAVGLLEDSRSEKLLVFFQVSIQSYEKHHCVSDLFSQSHLKLRDKGGVWKTGISIFKHYENLCEFKTVLLVYVSPMEGSETKGFQTFKSQIASRSNAKEHTIYRAVLSDNSTFHEQMKKLKPFKHYFCT